MLWFETFNSADAGSMVIYRPKSKFYGIFSRFDGVPVKNQKNVETEKHIGAH